MSHIDDDTSDFVNTSDENEAIQKSAGIKGLEIDSEILENIKPIVEALIFSSNKALNLDAIQDCLDPEYQISKQQLRSLITLISDHYRDTAIELVELGGAYRFQTKSKYGSWVQRLWEEKPQKYSRALLETLALIAYRQPITRGDIEEVRGVAVSSNIMKTLVERGWVRVIGHREVPGRPSIYATTKDFLSYFNLESLEDLPTLAEIRDLDLISKEVNAQLELKELGDQEESSTKQIESSTKQIESSTEQKLSSTEKEPTSNDHNSYQDKDDTVNSLTPSLFDQ